MNEWLRDVAAKSGYAADLLEEAYAVDLMENTEKKTGVLNLMHRSYGCLTLLLAERRAPDARLEERIRAHLCNLVAPGKAPLFDLAPYWFFPATVAVITLAKATPAVWDGLSADDKERLTRMIQCFAVLCAFGTDDENEYRTGPGLIGNYGKGWNPNYRLANVPQIVFCKYFFASSEKLNQILADFEMDEYVAAFREYGWENNEKCWGRTENDVPGVPFVTPKELMENGGDAFLITRNDSSAVRLGVVAGKPAGTGIGVRAVGKRGYLYHGHTADDAAGILNDLLRHCYGGGPAISRYGEYPEGVTDDLGSSFKAYIVDGTETPVAGKEGMMKEYASGDGGDGKHGSDIRSSAGYCLHDFQMVVVCLLVAKELGIYDISAPENAEVMALVKVGNADHIYKLEHGYRCYSLGSPHGISREGKDSGYFFGKALWQHSFGNDPA